ncbi:MAG TPA: D-alanine--D-alanine ligase [Flavisolibacter sp.]|jgi:D-alanine-D-alanine ligase|nr:D-alanine--D-alanine ligase [Flavisolibacter sp.]
MKKKIALVTGGYSGEAVVSYRTAANVLNALDKNKYDVYKIDLTQDGWTYENGSGKKISVSKEDFTLTIEGQKISFDVAFIAMHGTPGEDGKLQGYFDMLGIPYTSCNATTSALTFNKRYTTAVASVAGIPVAASMLLFKNSPYSTENILQMKLPFFVKPNNGGSSIGMSKVTQAPQLEAAIQKAFTEDDQVLIEEMIQGREFTVGVFKAGGEITVLPITEVVTHNEFFDFEAKYEGKSSETTPADIPEEWESVLVSTAKKIYEAFNCNGVVRIDFIYNDLENKAYMLEINTIPGQTDASVIPQQVRAKGWNLTDFYTKIVEGSFQQ